MKKEEEKTEDETKERVQKPESNHNTHIHKAIQKPYLYLHTKSKHQALLLTNKWRRRTSLLSTI
jgi:hypothetical protein